MLTHTPAGKRPLGRPRLRCEDNVGMDFKEISTNTRNQVDSDQDRDYWRDLVNAASNLRVLKLWNQLFQNNNIFTTRLRDFINHKETSRSFLTCYSGFLNRGC